MDIKTQSFLAGKIFKICYSNFSSVEVRKVKSGVICAALCVHHRTCCSVGFNKQTGECVLDYACFPECVPSQNATFLRKITYETANNETTVSEITKEKTTKFDITSESATLSVTTSERTTNHGTTIEKQTSQKPTSNGLLDCSGVSVGSSSGVYTIYVENQPLDVYCELIGSDQWTVINFKF
ncbi:unnamed protein product [Mytilus coruscus]|uniref:Uncharacterized protein n=1 Tax=Mytilus coruscus TaxID=42192 RepID=A0A6J7ZZV1_MYTCO|nr:unnamed protein product [Mytilus coruscus]